MPNTHNAQLTTFLQKNTTLLWRFRVLQRGYILEHEISRPVGARAAFYDLLSVFVNQQIASPTAYAIE